jgi:hypothetical protein
MLVATAMITAAVLAAAVLATAMRLAAPMASGRGRMRAVSAAWCAMRPALSMRRAWRRMRSVRLVLGIVMRGVRRSGVVRVDNARAGERRRMRRRANRRPAVVDRG